MVRWSRGSGDVELKMTLAQARGASHPGDCDEDVMTLSKVPVIAAQLEQLDPAHVRRELERYGVWSTLELQDHPRNLQRILWLAAGDLVAEHSNLPKRRKPKPLSA